MNVTVSQKPGVSKVRKIFYLFLTITFIAFWFKLVDFEKAIEAVRNVKWQFIILALILGLFNSLVGALRLKTLFSVIADISVRFIWGLGYITALVSVLLPFYLGGISFAYLIAKKAKSSYAKSFSIIFFDFFIGVVITAIFAFFGIFYFYQKKLLSLKLLAFDSLGYAFLAVFLFVILVISSIVLRNKVSVAKKLFVKLKRGVALFNKDILLRTGILTLVMVILGTSANYLNYMAFGMRPPILDFLLAGSLFGVLSMIPGAPTKIGQYETLGVLTLPYLLNLDKNSIFAMLLFTHVVSITTTLALGFLSLYFLRLDLKIFGALSGAKKNFLSKFSKLK